MLEYPDASHISSRKIILFTVLLLYCFLIYYKTHNIVNKFIYLILHNLLINDELNNDEILFFLIVIMKLLLQILKCISIIFLCSSFVSFAFQ